MAFRFQLYNITQLINANLIELLKKLKTIIFIFILLLTEYQFLYFLNFSNRYHKMQQYQSNNKFEINHINKQGKQKRKDNFGSEQKNNKKNVKQNQHLDILNCFDNLSLVIEEDLNNNKPVNASDELVNKLIQSIDKLQSNVCVQPKKYQMWSLSNSSEFVQKNEEHQRTIVKEGVIQQYVQSNLNYKRQANKHSKMVQSILQQYSFNVQQSSSSGILNNYLPPSKAPLAILIQKLDSFLKKENSKGKSCFSSKPSTMQNSGVETNSLTNQKNSQIMKPRQDLYNTNSKQNLLQKIQFYTSYIQDLQGQNIELKNNCKNLQQQNQIFIAQISKLDNNLKEKQIIIKYLTDQINSLNKKQNQNQNDQKRHVLKQRNTVDGQLLQNYGQKTGKIDCSPNMINKRRASQYVQSKNNTNNGQSFNKNKENHNQNMNKNPLIQNSFKKCGIPKVSPNFPSHRLSFGSFANSSNNKKKSDKNQFQQVPLMLRKQNQILITKLNILYQDYQNLISKFNQMCSQKEHQNKSMGKDKTQNNDKGKDNKKANNKRHINTYQKYEQSIIQFGYQDKINQIINKIKNRTKTENCTKTLNFNHPTQQLKNLHFKKRQKNIQRQFQTQESMFLFKQQLDNKLYKNNPRHQRVKSQLLILKPQPQTERTFFNQDMKPVIYSYNNSFCEEQNFQYNTKNYIPQKQNFGLDFKKNKIVDLNDQRKKPRSRQAPKSQRTSTNQKSYRVVQLQ